jgi:hypothetical protein
MSYVDGCLHHHLSNSEILHDFKPVATHGRISLDKKSVSWNYPEYFRQNKIWKREPDFNHSKILAFEATGFHMLDDIELTLM